MSLFLITRTDPVDYDEYDAIVVRAPTEEAARAVVAANGDGFMPEDHGTLYGSFRRGQFTVQKLTTAGPPRIVLASFNAG